MRWALEPSKASCGASLGFFLGFGASEKGFTMKKRGFTMKKGPQSRCNWEKCGNSMTLEELGNIVDYHEL